MDSATANKTVRSLPAAILLVGALLPAGCESMPPPTADDAPQANVLTVTVKLGDTVSEIAARYNVSTATLNDMNGLSGTSRIYPGEVLRVPGNARVAGEGATGDAAPEHLVSSTPRAPRATVDVSALNVPQQEPKDTKMGRVPAGRPQPARSAPEFANTAPESVPLTSGEFEWPVEGKVISAFGKDADGTRNDGINIAVELGTPIHAAAAGTVTYVGNKLKGYGNLILIRHDNGFITAYAHAQQIILSRGDRVDRGDVIGYSGKSGGVTTPQLHFEIRVGVKPVDPRPLLIGYRES